MASRVTDLDPILGSNLSGDDEVHIVDVSDVSDHPNGSSFRITVEELSNFIGLNLNDLNVSGTFTVNNDEMSIGRFLRHKDDSDTYMNMISNGIYFRAGGNGDNLVMTGTATILNSSGTSKDTIIETDNHSDAFFADAVDDSITLNVDYFALNQYTEGNTIARHRLSGGDFIHESVNGGDILQLVDAGASTDIVANPYQEWHRCNGIGASLVRLGFFGFSSTTNRDITLKNELAAGDIRLRTDSDVELLLDDGANVAHLRARNVYLSDSAFNGTHTFTFFGGGGNQSVNPIHQLDFHNLDTSGAERVQAQIKTIPVYSGGHGIHMDFHVGDSSSAPARAMRLEGSTGNVIVDNGLSLGQTLTLSGTSALEGGQINFNPGSDYSGTISLDSYANQFRVFTSSVNSKSLELFNTGTGGFNLSVTGSGTFRNSSAHNGIKIQQFSNNNVVIDNVDGGSHFFRTSGSDRVVISSTNTRFVNNDIIIEDTYPQLRFHDTNNTGANESRWRFGVEASGRFTLDALNDNDSFGSYAFIVNRTGGEADSFQVTTGRTSLPANSNTTDDYPLVIPNAAFNYGLSIGPYRLSNKDYGATNITYSIDIGNDLVIDVGDDCFIKNDAEGWSHYFGNGDLVLRSVNGGDMFQMIDAGATNATQCVAYGEINYSNGIGASQTRAALWGYASSGNTDFYLWNYEGDTFRIGNSGSDGKARFMLEEISVEGAGGASLYLQDNSAATDNGVFQFRADEGLLRGSIRNDAKDQYTNFLRVFTTSHTQVDELELKADKLSLESSVIDLGIYANRVVSDTTGLYIEQRTSTNDILQLSSVGDMVFETDPNNVTSNGEYIWKSNGSNLMILSDNGFLNVPGIYSSTTALGSNVYVNSNGGLFRTTSSKRYKKSIKTLPLEKAKRVLEMKPVSYKSKSEHDNSDYTYYGLIAEDLAELDPRLVTFDEEGKPDGVQYDRVVPMLVGMIQDLNKRITKLEEKYA